MATSKKQREKDFEELEKTAKKDFKVRITTMIDSDIYLELHKVAKEKGVKYQTLLNEILREHLIQGNTELEQIKKLLIKIDKKIAA